jgi:protein-S-isoprenylcysteine O-methyltransferase Ste14
MQRLLPPLLLIITLAVMIIAAYVWPVADVVSQPVRWIGGIAALAGLVIAAKGARAFKLMGTNIKTFDAPQKLVTSGLFARSRNPMYLGFALCAVGFGTALGSASPLCIAAVFCIILDRWYVRFEEIVMHDTFGAEYEQYRARVRRWF